jgi:hypothetical protein
MLRSAITTMTATWISQIEYTGHNWRWRMPSHYFKVSELLADGTAVDFFFTDTHPIRRAYRNWVRLVYFPPGEQVEWLERELAASRADWKIVVGHHPVYSGGRHGNTDGLIEQFVPLFKRHGVQAYLNGHNHNLEHVVADGIHYLTSGAASQPKPAAVIPGSRFAFSGLGFMNARLSRDFLAIEFFDAEAKPLHTRRSRVAPGSPGKTIMRSARAETERFQPRLRQPSRNVVTAFATWRRIAALFGCGSMPRLAASMRSVRSMAMNCSAASSRLVKATSPRAS